MTEIYESLMIFFVCFFVLILQETGFNNKGNISFLLVNYFQFYLPLVIVWCLINDFSLFLSNEGMTEVAGEKSGD